MLIPRRLARPERRNGYWDLDGKRGEYDDGVQSAASSSGAKTWTFSSARAGVASLAALRPAP